LRYDPIACFLFLKLTPTIQVQAQKQTTIEQLPRVMMIHLKRFTYDTSQAHKLDKFVSFPLRLSLKNAFLSSEKIATDAQKQYSLFAGKSFSYYQHVKVYLTMVQLCHIMAKCQQKDTIHAIS
jgi:hypothetical protein